jgi:hypothetical protein
VFAEVRLEGRIQFDIAGVVEEQVKLYLIAFRPRNVERVQTVPAGWKGSLLPATIAALVQTHADRHHPLPATLARNLPRRETIWYVLARVTRKNRPTRQRYYSP